MSAHGPVLDPAAPDPVAGPGGAIVRPRRAAVFHPLPDELGAIPGSDFAGVIDRLHESADAAERRRLVSQRVVGLADIACTRCDLCRGGLSVHCRERRTLGTAAAAGCLAERFEIPVRNLVTIPDSLGDDEAVFAPTLAAAIHAAQSVRLEGGAFVTVLGDSVLALLCAQVLAARTPAVRLLGQHAERFTLCEKWGIKHRHESEAGRRADQTAVIDCTGTAAGFALAMRLVRPRGMIVLAERGGAGVDLRAVTDAELVLIGARSGPLRDAVAMLSRGAVDVLSLVTRRARLDQAPAALHGESGLSLLIEC